MFNLQKHIVIIRFILLGTNSCSVSRNLLLKRFKSSISNVIIKCRFISFCINNTILFSYSSISFYFNLIVCILFNLCPQHIKTILVKILGFLYVFYFNILSHILLA
nr:MAG TPA_asm: hypothetical protein [Caudoviricetes sp.]